MIRAIFFDLDDTLVDSAPAWRAGLDAAFARLHERWPDLSREAIQAAWQGASRTLGARLDSGELTVAQVRERRWREALGALGALGITDNALAAELEAKLAETFIGGLRLYDDAADVLDRLSGRAFTERPYDQSSGERPYDQSSGERPYDKAHSGRPYHLGIITNGAADEALDSQYTKALRTGLLDRVDSFLASDAAGYRKPDSRIFALALERAGIAPHEAIYVGDSIGNDVVGANRAGMVSVLLWRWNEPLPALEGEQRPAWVIASLVEVERILA